MSVSCLVIPSFFNINYYTVDKLPDCDSRDKHDGHPYCEFSDGFTYVSEDYGFDPTPCHQYRDSFAFSYYNSLPRHDVEYYLSLNGTFIHGGRLYLPVPDAPDMIRWDGSDSCWYFTDLCIFYDLFHCEFSDDLSWLRRFLGG